MEETLKRLQQWISESDNIVFFGGAGVSTESGISDFRSVDGLYHQSYRYPPEKILGHSFFEGNPEEFYRFYHEKLVCPGVQPNAAHRKLAELEQAGKLRAVVTQNIDGLHQAAGSREVLELHGSTHRCYCAACRKPYPEASINDCDGVPRCSCGGVIRPDVVLYEESLDGDVMNRAIDYISRADVLIIGGTSLVVYPAAGLVRYYNGGKLVLINRDPTPCDRSANLVINDSIGAVLGAIQVSGVGA
ncbi:MAG: D-dependent protein deacetylase of family [Oscillospiraceae bacterium]|nr:D-dependent protein deacetylase of family [Oscillospiraceae bacterium]